MPSSKSEDGEENIGQSMEAGTIRGKRGQSGAVSEAEAESATESQAESRVASVVQSGAGSEAEPESAAESRAASVVQSGAGSETEPESGAGIVSLLKGARKIREFLTHQELFDILTKADIATEALSEIPDGPKKDCYFVVDSICERSNEFSRRCGCLE